MSLARRINKLVSQPAFRTNPVRVLARAGLWSMAVALRRSPVFRLTPGGERMRAPVDFRYTSITAFLLRDWVEPELRELGRLLKPGDVFIDIGANIGLYALKAARIVGSDGTVLALEPGAEAFGHLRANLALNAYPWARALQVAASDADGEAQLHHVPLGNDPQAFSLVANAAATEAETVRTVKLDTLAAAEGLKRIDLVKIDVEGAEPMVIAGARKVLRGLKPAVIFECNAHLNAGGEAGAAGESWEMLSACGYGFWRLIEGAFMPIVASPADFCNVVAVHKTRPPPS